jgi:hypothetical protein
MTSYDIVPIGKSNKKYFAGFNFTSMFGKNKHSKNKKPVKSIKTTDQIDPTVDESIGVDSSTPLQMIQVNNEGDDMEEQISVYKPPTRSRQQQQSNPYTDQSQLATNSAAKFAYGCYQINQEFLNQQDALMEGVYELSPEMCKTAHSHMMEMEKNLQLMKRQCRYVSGMKKNLDSKQRTIDQRGF